MPTGSNPASSVGMPLGPWLILVGMHRSGTSATAGALGALGFNVPAGEVRMDSPSSNPEHWESHPLMLHNDDVLNLLGGSWDAPPDLAPGWEHGPAMSLANDPVPLVGAAYPDAGPLVWKDPRSCLLLPYWRTLIPGPRPRCSSGGRPWPWPAPCRRRDQLTLVHGLALWERYNLAALEGLRGTDVYVIDYESLMADPRTVIGEVADWLGALDQFAGHAGRWDVDRAASLGRRPPPAPGPGDEGGAHLSCRARLARRATGRAGRWAPPVRSRSTDRRVTVDQRRPRHPTGVAAALGPGAGPRGPRRGAQPAGGRAPFRDGEFPTIVGDDPGRTRDVRTNGDQHAGVDDWRVTRPLRSAAVKVPARLVPTR